MGTATLEDIANITNQQLRDFRSLANESEIVESGFPPTDSCGIVYAEASLDPELSRDNGLALRLRMWEQNTNGLVHTEKHLEIDEHNGLVRLQILDEADPAIVYSARNVSSEVISIDDLWGNFLVGYTPPSIKKRFQQIASVVIPSLDPNSDGGRILQFYKSLLKNPELAIPNEKVAAHLLGVSVRNYRDNIISRHPWIIREDETTTSGLLELYANLRAQTLLRETEEQLNKRLGETLGRIQEFEAGPESYLLRVSESFESSLKVTPSTSGIYSSRIPQELYGVPISLKHIIELFGLTSPQVKYLSSKNKEIIRGSRKLRYILLGNLVEVTEKRSMLNNDEKFQQLLEIAMENKLSGGGIPYSSRRRREKPSLQSPPSTALALRPEEYLGNLVTAKPVIQENMVNLDHPVSEAYERYILGRGKLSLYEIALQQRARGEYLLDQEGILIYHPSDKRFAEGVIIKDEATGKYKAIGRAVFHIKMGIGTIVKVEKSTIDIATQDGRKQFLINGQDENLDQRIWGLPLDDNLLCDGAKSMLDRPISADSQKKIDELAMGNNKLHMLLTYVQKRVPGYDGILGLVTELYNRPIRFVEKGVQNGPRGLRLLKGEYDNNLGALTIIGLVTSKIVDDIPALGGDYKVSIKQYTLNKAVAVPK